jgi:hypothetical protein
MEKAGYTRQVRAGKANESEPSMTCRKRRDATENGLQSLARDRVWGRSLLAAQMVTGMKAARAQLRLLCGTWEPIAPMSRENSKWKTHEEQSTNAG